MFGSSGTAALLALNTLLTFQRELLAFDRRLSRSLLTGIIRNDATQVSEVFHCIVVGAVDADLRRTVRFSWRGFIQHLSLLQADGEAEVFGCIREAVDDVLYGFLCVGEGHSRQ